MVNIIVIGLALLGSLELTIIYFKFSPLGKPEKKETNNDVKDGKCSFDLHLIETDLVLVKHHLRLHDPVKVDKRVACK